jgi:hypothetical protein
MSHPFGYVAYMEEKNSEIREESKSESQREPHSENFQTIKASQPILSIIKGLYDACGMPMYGPAATSDLLELPQWAKNICEQLRLTIFKRVLELIPEGEQMNWRTSGRMMGVCQRLAVYLKKTFAETDFKHPAASRQSGDANKPILVPPTDLVEQMEGAFIDSMDSALAQSSEDQFEFLCGLTEGYELFLDARGQFVGDRGRTTAFFELLSRWMEIEEMRKAKPSKTCADLYALVAPSLGDPRCERYEVFFRICRDISLSMTKRGRPRKCGENK